MAETSSPCLVRSFSQPFPKSGDGHEGDLLHALTSSISFGRYMTESLAWEKWSAFTHHNYREEALRYSRPGSVAEKKAFFEARLKTLPARKPATSSIDHSSNESHSAFDEGDQETAMAVHSTEQPICTKDQVEPKGGTLTMKESPESDETTHSSTAMKHSTKCGLSKPPPFQSKNSERNTHSSTAIDHSSNGCHPALDESGQETAMAVHSKQHTICSKEQQEIDQGTDKDMSFQDKKVTVTMGDALVPYGTNCSSTTKCGLPNPQPVKLLPPKKTVTVRPTSSSFSKNTTTKGSVTKKQFTPRSLHDEPIKMSSPIIQKIVNSKFVRAITQESRFQKSLIKLNTEEMQPEESLDEKDQEIAALKQTEEPQPLNASSYMDENVEPKDGTVTMKEAPVSDETTHSSTAMKPSTKCGLPKPPPFQSKNSEQNTHSSIAIDHSSNGRHPALDEGDQETAMAVHSKQHLICSKEQQEIDQRTDKDMSFQDKKVTVTMGDALVPDGMNHSTTTKCGLPNPQPVKLLPSKKTVHSTSSSFSKNTTTKGSVTKKQFTPRSLHDEPLKMSSPIIQKIVNSKFVRAITQESRFQKSLIKSNTEEMQPEEFLGEKDQEIAASKQTEEPQPFNASSYMDENVEPKDGTVTMKEAPVSDETTHSSTAMKPSTKCILPKPQSVKPPRFQSKKSETSSPVLQNIVNSKFVRAITNTTRGGKSKDSPARATSNSLAKHVTPEPESTSNLKSPSVYGSKTRPSTACSAFVFRSEERAIKRKEFYQKLEQKLKEEPQMQPKERTGKRSESVLKACTSRVKPNVVKKMAEMQHCSPKLQRVLKVQETNSSRPPWRVSAKTGFSKNVVVGTIKPLTHSAKSFPGEESRRENTSPNI